LIFENIQYDANGYYECVAYDQSPDPITFVIAEIEVVAPPRITFSPPMPMVVRSGDNVVIFCNTSGEQPIYVQWHTGDRSEFPPTVRASDKYLQFDHITPSDAGRYFCTAANQHGNVTKVAEVIVQR
jgi:Immunoglobulin domain